MKGQRKPTKGKSPSMYDVARAAGVSQTTVSFVVNDAPHVNIPQETRDRVWAAVEELGWRPNAMARGLSLKRSHTIGFLSNAIATAPYAGKIIQGAQDVAWIESKMLLIISADGNSAIEHAALEMMLERQVEGLIYAAMYHHAVEPPASLKQKPAVLLNCYVADRSLPLVVPDEVQGGRTATHHLLSKGHRRIGFINVADPIPAAVGRFEGYKEALEAYGVPFDPQIMRSGQGIAQDGYRYALELLRLPKRPTALFCFNDSVAMGAYDAAKQLGLAIPDDIAIIGFDNLELIATQLHPALTTVELPHYAMGQWAIQYMLGNADPSTASPVQQLLPCPLIERSST